MSHGTAHLGLLHQPHWTFSQPQLLMNRSRGLSAPDIANIQETHSKPSSKLVNNSHLRNICVVVSHRTQVRVTHTRPGLVSWPRVLQNLANEVLIFSPYHNNPINPTPTHGRVCALSIGPTRPIQLIYSLLPIGQFSKQQWTLPNRYPLQTAEFNQSPQQTHDSSLYPRIAACYVPPPSTSASLNIFSTSWSDASIPRSLSTWYVAPWAHAI